MCKVLVKEAQKNVDFIMYNLELSSEDVEKEVNYFIKAGLINQNFRCYSVCGR